MFYGDKEAPLAPVLRDGPEMDFSPSTRCWLGGRLVSFPA